MAVSTVCAQKGVERRHQLLMSRRCKRREKRRGDEMNAQSRIQAPEPASNCDDAAACAPHKQREPGEIDPGHWDFPPVAGRLARPLF